MRPRWPNWPASVHTVFMYRSRFREAIRDLDDLTVKQRRFLGRIAFRIPQLVKAIVAGETESRCELGTRQLKDGRKLELELVARAPENKWLGIAKTWGGGPEKSSFTDDESKKRSAKR